MSLNSKKSVKCPKCGQMSDIVVWNSITVKDSADLKQDVLAGKINMFHCASCSYSALMPVPLLYHDEEKKLLISFSPCDDPIKEETLYADIKKTSAMSNELKSFEGYNLRFITKYNDFLEKVLIFDSGLNDKAIEVLKLMVLSQDLEKAEQRTCFFGKTDDNGIEFMIQDKIENQVYTSTVPKESYNLIYSQLLNSGMKPYSFDWEVVNSAYATKLLNGFNN